MPIDGPTVYRTLRQELEQAREAADRRRDEAARLDERARALEADRGRSLVELARIALPAMDRQAIAGVLSTARDELLGLLAEQERHRSGLRNRLAQSADEVRRLEARVDDLTGTLNGLVERRNGLEVAVADALKADPEFRTRSEQAAEAEADLQRDERRLEELRAEARAKLPAFRNSRLFGYLLDRHYGTPEYAHRGLIRRLDRWVARLIDFPRARVSHDFLTRVPPLVEAEVARRRERFEKLMDRVEALQKSRADALGLTAVLDEGRRLGAERDRSVTALDAARKAAADLERQHAELAGPGNAFHREALDRLRSAMDRAGAAALEQMARRTPGPEDDALVARIRAAERSLADLKAEAARLAADRDRADRDLAALQELDRRFRAADYDSARSEFSDRLDLDALRRGSTDVEGCWRALRSSQRFQPPPLARPDAPGSFAGALNSPEGRILTEAIGSVVQGAVLGAVLRGVERRSGPAGGQAHRPTPTPTSPRPSPPVAPPPPPRPSPPPVRMRPGGFTSGNGF